MCIILNEILNTRDRMYDICFQERVSSFSGDGVNQIQSFINLECFHETS